MREGLTFKDLLHILGKRWLTVVATAATLCISVLIITQFVLQPTYQVSTQVLFVAVAQEKSDETSYTGVGNQLITSYTDIIKSPSVMGEVKKSLKLERSVYELINQVSVIHTQNSQVVTIIVKDHDPVIVKKIADTTALVSQKQMKEFMKAGKFQLVLENGKTESPEMIFPKPMMSLAIALVSGLVSGVGAALVKEYIKSARRKRTMESILRVHTHTKQTVYNLEERQKKAAK